MEFIDDEKLRKLYEKTIAKLDAQEKRDFRGSGALGPIPDSFPEEKAWDLYDLRKKLKEQYGIRKLKSLMKEEKLIRDTGEPFSCDANISLDRSDVFTNLFSIPRIYFPNHTITINFF